MNIREAAAWRVMTEVVRRSPTELRILESHPGGGLWDCLGLVDRTGRSLLSLNRSGALCFHETLDGEDISRKRTAFYELLLEERNMPRIVRGICHSLRIPSYRILPPTTRESLVYRYVSALMDSAILANRDWECRNGYFHTSGLGEGQRPDFDAFPLAKKHLAAARGENRIRPAASAYWFIQVNGTPQLCLSLDAMVWDRDLNATDLFQAYRARRRLWPLILETAGFLLP